MVGNLAIVPEAVEGKCLTPHLDIFNRWKALTRLPVF